MTKLTGKPTGRPPCYTPELAKIICARIAEGESVRTIAKDPDMPNASTIHKWVLDDTEGFSKHYADAKAIGAEIENDEIIEIAETHEDLQRAKLIIDTKKWTMSKKLPGRFGDKLDVTSGGDKLSIGFDSSLKGE